MKQRGLGRGFDTLIPTDVTTDLDESVKPASGEAIQQVDPKRIVPNPHQPRSHFDESELKGLADSIKQHGVVHPPVVSDAGDGTFELIAGERRVRAAKLAGLKTIPVIVRSFDEQQKLELALLENVQRAQLNPIETALAYKKLGDEFNLTQEQIGSRMGKAKSTVANSLRLLQLPKPALDALAKGGISEAHGRAILAISDPKRQQELLDHILKEKWSVRQAEAFVRADKPAKPEAKAVATTDTPVASESQNFLAQELADYLQTKVSVVPSPKGGKIVVEYYSDEELERIFETIKPTES